MTPVERLLANLSDHKKTATDWMARCPAHEDRRASSSVAEGDDGRVLVKCHAGCTVEEVCAAVGLRLADLMPAPTAIPSNGKSTRKEGVLGAKPRIRSTYDYRDESGNVVFQVVRLEPKDFRQRKPDGCGGWNWSVGKARRPDGSA